jgi:1-deoxy-D-xylulose-5-phosphate synthase
MASPFFQKMKKGTEHLLEHLPESATYMAKKFEESLRLITPGILFEELGIEYIGPVDGHDIEGLIETFQIAKEIGRPVLIHAQTTKGKGYEIAEGTKEHWHGVSAFDLKTGDANKKSAAKAATAIFGDALVELADSDEKIVGVTAAMPSGTGLSAAMKKYPERFWDVAIAEQHAVTSMGALAKEGFKPFCAIYSTFLQRGYDQIIHDVALMDIGVTFAIDRAGIVGEDGETHQGVFDISFLRAIPNMTLLAPYNESSMIEAMRFCKDYNHPVALRYPRGAFSTDDAPCEPYTLGKSVLLQEGQDLLFIGYGNGVGRAFTTAEYFDEEIGILDLRFVKPLDEEKLKELSQSYAQWFVFSDSAKMGGVGSALLEFLNENKLQNISLTTFEYNDHFITHGNTTLVEESLGLLPEQLAETIKKIRS